MDRKRRNRYKEKKWIEEEGIDTRRRNGYKSRRNRYKENKWIQGEGM